MTSHAKLIAFFLSVACAQIWAQESTFPGQDEVKLTSAIRQNFNDEALDAIDLLDESAAGSRSATDAAALAVRKLRRSAATAGEWELAFDVAGYAFRMEGCRIARMNPCAGLYESRDKAVRLAKTAPLLEESKPK